MLLCIRLYNGKTWSSLNIYWDGMCKSLLQLEKVISLTIFGAMYTIDQDGTLVHFPRILHNKLDRV